MKSADRVALIAVTQHGCVQARLLRQRLRRGELHRPARYGASEQTWEHAFAEPLSHVVGPLFARYDQLVFFLAAGAVVRLIAPHLGDKASDPGVLALDEGGQFVIPLLSGHEGGANAFARHVAGCLGATPVITTASETCGGLSLDWLETQFGWIAEPRERLKDTAVSLLNRVPVAIVQEIGTRGAWLDELGLPDHVTFTSDPGRRGLGAPEEGPSIVRISDRTDADADHRVLWLRPPSLVLGVGCERGISVDALDEGLSRFLGAHRYALSSIAVLASVTVKADEEALLELARRHGWETRFFLPEQLAAVADMPTPSAVVEKCVGTPGVAEPAALLASGADRLLVAKQVIASPLAPQRMTFALARDARYTARSDTGRVTFVSAGPGDPELLTLKAQHVLQRADVVVYAGSLIPEPVLRHVRASAVVHNSAPLTLEQVMEIVLTAVRAGKHVARLQSGDTSLYSAIQEQMRLLDVTGVEYDVVPGVSSYQAAAAALCSELTLPEVVQTVILTRGEGATPMPAAESLARLAQHRATLCIFLSARLGDDVQRQLLTAYPPETPVALVYRVSWPDEQIVRTRLDRLAAELRTHSFERTTLILVGPAVGGRGHRSHLYSASHGHIFRKRSRAHDDPAS